MDGEGGDDDADRPPMEEQAETVAENDETAADGAASSGPAAQA